MGASADDGAVAAAKPWAVYLLHCAGGRSYIGISPAPHERFEVHRTGKGAAFTRANRPQALAAVVEVRLKTLPRSAKLAWFERFAAATVSVPATLDVGLASLTSRRLCSLT